MKTVFQKCLCAAAMLFVVSSFSSSASAQAATGTLPFGGPWGATPGQPFGPMDTRQITEAGPMALGVYGNPFIYNNFPGYGIGMMTYPSRSMGMVASDPKRPITPRLTESIPSVEAEAKLIQLQRDQIATEATINTLRSHAAEQWKSIFLKSTALLAAENSGKPTASIQADIAKLQRENKLFTDALKDASENLEKIKKDETLLRKSQTTDTSNGWVIVDTKAEKKGNQEQPLACASGQRLVSRYNPGLISSFACLDAKGYIMKETSQPILPTRHTSPTTTVYERDGENLKSVTTLDKDGKPMYERTLSSNQETHKYFDKGAVQSSCTYYGDEASRAKGDGYNRTKTNR